MRLDVGAQERQSRLTITGLAADPRHRAGHRFKVSLWAGDGPSQDHPPISTMPRSATATALPNTAHNRGTEIPVYDPPSGLGLLEKVRREPYWTAWLSVEPQFVTDALALLNQMQPCT